MWVKERADGACLAQVFERRRDAVSGLFPKMPAEFQAPVDAMAGILLLAGGSDDGLDAGT